MFNVKVDDFVRGVYFEDAFDSTAFYLRALFLPLFIPRDSISFLHGDRLRRSDGSLWHEGHADLVTLLKETIESQALPFLESVSTLPGVIACVKQDVERDWPRYNSHHLEELAYLYVKSGEYPAALESLSRLKRDLENDPTPWIAAQRSRAQLIEMKLLESPEMALSQFEEWKKQTVINLGLEKYAGQR